jgi:hypothetical protein
MKLPFIDDALLYTTVPILLYIIEHIERRGVVMYVDIL